MLNTNAVPQLAVPADRTLREGDTIEFVLSARDDDGDPLHFTSVNLPTGATLQPASGLFSWTPGFDQHGSYQISLRVSDGQATTQQSFQLQVLNVNGPVDLLPLGQFEIVEDQLLALRIAAHDPDHPQTTDSPIVFDQDPNIDAGQGLPALSTRTRRCPRALSSMPRPGCLRGVPIIGKPESTRSPSRSLMMATVRVPPPKIPRPCGSEC